MVMPIKRLWNHRTISGPSSISIRRPSSPEADRSMLVLPDTSPPALETTLCAASKMPMTMVQVLVMIRIAQAVLKIHLKKTADSISWKLFLSVMIWMSSSVITKARITPAMGSITVSESDRIML